VQKVSTKKAQTEVRELLSKIGLEKIAEKRYSDLSNTEIFYSMFIRAMLTKKSNIVIELPYLLVDELESFEKIVQNLKLLEDKKSIIVLDYKKNHFHYKGYIDAII